MDEDRYLQILDPSYLAENEVSLSFHWNSKYDGVIHVSSRLPKTAYRFAIGSDMSEVLPKALEDHFSRDLTFGNA